MWKRYPFRLCFISNSKTSMLKLPHECGPTISDHTKKYCRNKRSMITLEAWTPVIINSQCSSIKWIEHSTKYVLPRIQVYLYLCIKEICQLVKNRKWIPVTAEESFPGFFLITTDKAPFFNSTARKWGLCVSRQSPFFLSLKPRRNNYSPQIWLENFERRWKYKTSLTVKAFEREI